MAAAFEGNSPNTPNVWVSVSFEVDEDAFVVLELEREDGGSMDFICSDLADVEDFFDMVAKAREQWNNRH